MAGASGSTRTFQPEPYKVSTITAIGSLNTEIDLSLLFHNLPILDTVDTVNNGFTFAEFGRKQDNVNYRGDHKKVLLAAKRPPPKTRRFDNQVTVVYRKRINISSPTIPLNFRDNFQCLEHDEGAFVTANMKIFNNGNVQITGLKYINHGQEYIETMVEVLRLLHNMGIAAAKNIDTMHASNYSVQLINTDFRIGFDIKREKLYKVLLQKYPGIYATYEPCIYPGVKIHYKWNTNQEPVNGVCQCDCPCKGKGTGVGDGQCKRVTIAVFQSGCIIITGAQTQEQIDQTYKFINNVISQNFNEIYKPPIEECIARLELKKKDKPALPAPAKTLALQNKKKPVLALTHHTTVSTDANANVVCI